MHASSTRRFSLAAALRSATARNSTTTALPVPDPQLAEIHQTITASWDQCYHCSEDSSWSLLSTDAGSSLRRELELLYWHGVRAELRNVLDTLVAWDTTPLKEDLGLSAEERDTFVHGFDTFIDHVSYDGRQFAAQVAKWRDKPASPAHTAHYQHALERTARDTRKQMRVEKLRCHIRESAAAQLNHALENETTVHRRARMLMRAAGLLDIDKVLEHQVGGRGLSRARQRSHEDKIAQAKHQPPSQPSKAVVPQLTVKHIDSKNGLPIVEAVCCSACRDSVRGSSYIYLPHRLPGVPNYSQTVGGGTTTDQLPYVLCETCRSVLPENQQLLFSKTYKHSVATLEVTSAHRSHELCTCTTYAAPQPKSRLRLVPGRKAPRIRCALYELPTAVHNASKVGMGLTDEGTAAWPQRLFTPVTPSAARRMVNNFKRSKTGGSSATECDHDEIYDEADTNHISDQASVEPDDLEAKADGGSKAPLGKNTVKGSSVAGKSDDTNRLLQEGHTYLRFGPLVIETEGAKSGESGRIRISLRDDLSLQPRYRHDVSSHYPDLAMVFTENSDHHPEKNNGRPHLYTQSKHSPEFECDQRVKRRRRIKCIQKQIVGSPFSQMNDPREDMILDNLVELAQLRADKGDTTIDALLDEIKGLVSQKLGVYLDEIVPRLLSACPRNLRQWAGQTTLSRARMSWRFCDFILDRPLWHHLTGPVLQGSTDAPDGQTTKSSASKPRDPQYVMSFVCRSQKTRNIPRTKYDVSPGLTQEYLLAPVITQKQHASDIVDSLQEYWHDWAGFGRTLYRYQDLFPWDCTKAFDDFSVTCGGGGGTGIGCNLARHVWAFPFDSWSIIALHLSRRREDYPGRESPHLNNKEWAQNRLLLVCALEKLTAVAACMADSAGFRDATGWLAGSSALVVDEVASVLDETDAAKMSGIHRAQPYIREGPDKPILAPWVHCARSGKITPSKIILEYEYSRPWQDRGNFFGFDLDKDDGRDVDLRGHRRNVFRRPRNPYSRLGYSVGGSPDVTSSRRSVWNAGYCMAEVGGYRPLHLTSLRGFYEPVGSDISGTPVNLARQFAAVQGKNPPVKASAEASKARVRNSSGHVTSGSNGTSTSTSSPWHPGVMYHGLYMDPGSSYWCKAGIDAGNPGFVSSSGGGGGGGCGGGTSDFSGGGGSSGGGMDSSCGGF